MGKKHRREPVDRAPVVGGLSVNKKKKVKAKGVKDAQKKAAAGGGASNSNGAGGYDPKRALSKPAAPPPSYTASSTTHGGYITPSHDEYDTCVGRSYVGFRVDPPSILPDALHADVADAFRVMTKRGMFTRDVLAAGKSVSPTFVSRTLVGDRGMTYHYQKLRIFALPWDDELTPEGSPLRTVKRLNDAMKQRSRALLAKHADPRVKVTGSCEFNVTLINLMEPERRESMALKDEGQFGMGKASVSWHSDSSLQDTSTVAVYHQTAGGIDGDDTSWHIALKCLDDVTPALRVPLNSHETYYMMRDFNMHHHHAVLNGDTRRFSSTHRVAVVAKDTFEYIQGKCTRALRTLPLLKWHAGKAPRGWKVNKSTPPEPLSKILHVLGDAHREVEFQWLRMFWLQGTRHASQHETYWAARIEELTQAWDAMELGLRWACDACRLAADGKAKTEPRAFEMLRYLLETIAECREEHDARCEAGAYAQVPEDCRPIDLPRFDDKSPLPRDLRPVLTTLELWRRKAFAR